METRDPTGTNADSPPDADGRLVATHWGTYLGSIQADGHLLMRPLGVDPAPSPLANGYAEVADHPLRIGSPAVRQGWMESRASGKEDPRGRGVEPFVALSWEEAIRLAADEVRRVAETFGNEAIFAGSYGWASAGRFSHAQSQLKRFMTLAGGFTFAKNTYSYGAGAVIIAHVLGPEYAEPTSCAADWSSIASTRAFVLAFGGLPLRNSQVEAGGCIRHRIPDALRRCAEAGCRFTIVSPVSDDMPPFLTGDCIRIRPGTDTAFMLGIAYALIRDRRVDEAFLARCTVGYTAVKQYVLGREDGVPKSPEWAAAICDCPAARIEEVARRLVDGPSLITGSWSLQRAEHGEQPYWMIITLAALIGQIGRPGCGLSFGLGSVNAAGRRGVRLVGRAFPQGENPVETFIPVARIADLLLNPGGSIEYDGQRLRLPDIRLIYWAGGNPFHHHQDLSRLRRAWRNPETVIVNETHWNATARHADIVFPVTVGYERDDICASSRGSEIVFSRQVTPARGEAKTDHEVFRLMAARLGFEEAFTEGRSVEEWLRWIYEGYRDRYPELPSFERFEALGAVDYADLVAKAGPGVPLKAFVNDPRAAPLSTPSGRIELYSETIASFGYGDCPGHACWLPPREWLGSSLARRFPLHLLTPQPENRLHSQLDQTSSGRRGKVAGREPVLINPCDAGPRGIEDGQVVRVFNDRGACLAGARVTDRVRPGVVVMATGAWYDPDDPAAKLPLDRNGNPNVLTPDVGCSRLSQGPSPNSCLVDVSVERDPAPIGCYTPPRIIGA